MAKITINEISRNYNYSVGAASYATVALPITACWGPGFVDPDTVGMSLEDVLERTSWSRYGASQEGLEAFVADYRGPASNYRITKDYSYQVATTLLAAGYDILVCRLCPGSMAAGSIKIGNATLDIQAKYPGSFGNNLMIRFKKVLNRNYWNLVVYVKDSNTGVTTAAENLTFYFDLNSPQEMIDHIEEIESKFITLKVTGYVDDKMSDFKMSEATLTGGTDKAADGEDAGVIMDKAIELAKTRFASIGYTTAVADECMYVQALNDAKTALSEAKDVNTAANHSYMEWLYRYVLDVYDLLKDKLTYNPNRIISPGWDDMNTTAINDVVIEELDIVSPMHCKMMEVAYYSRCACAYLCIPKALPRKAVYNESMETPGYAQMLSRCESHPNYSTLTANDDSFNPSFYPTHSALFSMWGQYLYSGTSKQATACPSFLVLMMERAMIKNQALQYEWALPTNRRHNINVGKLDYTVPKKLLDEWQKLEGVGVNVIVNLPDLGTAIWGNSTLFETPPATYQALANLSTRKLMNAVKDLAYRCGLAITFQYNNADAYASFYAGLTPLLDTMKNVGAIEGYKIEMAADVSGLDRVNLNSVIGKVTLYVNGVINDITIDLIALPAGVDAE